ncbi:BaiN/RdsA family NAD(P)/FAD-dependent oxidoreductase [Phytohalomonas tamaricis]|uniref:NAD(P)/FAD-dependent oxidoreductase n=1 Tax=Phytohalomonas tamaricis TaxID=2081032 RepID=UPI000D0BD161|nr:NAD(P)/FAD-dependent oxidoreductase [Phytohalomonas tamaricis]
MTRYDAVIIGAGAAGMMCALTAGYRGKRVLVLDHANKAGKKILMSGGGRCNFTNLDTKPGNFFSNNPHFCISALKRYSPHDFVDMVERHGIEHVEKAPGQLFCADSSKSIVQMLLTECEWAGVELRLGTSINAIEDDCDGMMLDTSIGRISAVKVVIATGGLSIPTLGASGFGYDVARQFGLDILPTRAALVPFTLTSEWKERLSPLAGISVPVTVACRNGFYREPLLITHRGLSGPAMLQISSYWLPGDSITIDWLPGVRIAERLAFERNNTPKRQLSSWLNDYIPKRLTQAVCQWFEIEGTLAQCSNSALEELEEKLNRFTIKPAGTEGWRTAEVTMGGVNTQAISSKTFAVNEKPALHFIGEVLDVTGELGGYNFQWAWASGVACGQAL